MPELLLHLEFAQKVSNILNKDIYLNKITFFAGNIIPDYAKYKSDSHFLIKDETRRFTVPDLEQAKRKLLDLNNSLLLGIYAHLFFDFYFVNSFLKSEFAYDSKRKVLIRKKNGYRVGLDEFFSYSGIYGAYQQLNSKILAYNPELLKIIESMPDDLPLSKVRIYDKRKNMKWKNSFLRSLKITNNGYNNFLDYNEVEAFIEKLASQFVFTLVK